MRAALVFALAAAVAAILPDSPPTAQFAGEWRLEAGIYGTDKHFGPASYLCGVAYELWYLGTDRLEELDIAALFPVEFRSVALPGMEPYTTGWQRPPLPTGHGGLVEAALWKHAGGAVGAACRNGPSDLYALRGTRLRVAWRSSTGQHEQVFSIDLVRGEVTLCAGYFTRDGQTHPVWGRDRC